VFCTTSQRKFVVDTWDRSRMRVWVVPGTGPPKRLCHDRRWWAQAVADAGELAGVLPLQRATSTNPQQPHSLFARPKALQRSRDHSMECR